MTDDEAVGILIRARLEADKGGLVQARKLAGKKLHDAVLGAAVAAGYDVSLDDNGNDVIKTEPSVPNGAAFNADGNGVNVWRYVKGGPDDAAMLDPPRIAFDAVRGEWIGTEYDERIAVVPGKPKPKRSAVAAVADRIVEALTKLDSGR